MKRRDLIKKLEDAGFQFSEHGGSHDKYVRGNDTEIIPRHREIKETTAKVCPSIKTACTTCNISSIKIKMYGEVFVPHQ